MQFFGTGAAVEGIGEDVYVEGCPAEKETHPFVPI
jgi:hypothetical protein